MREGGEAIADIIEDYPYLHQDDIEFAWLYFKAHPVLGRPPRRGERKSSQPPLQGEAVTRKRGRWGRHSIERLIYNGTAAHPDACGGRPLPCRGG